MTSAEGPARSGGSGAGSGQRPHRWLHGWWRSPAKTAALTGISLLACVVAGLIATGWTGQFDLRIYYDAIAHWRSGGDLYGYARPDPTMGALGFTYPPAAALAMFPMALLPFEVVRALTLGAIAAAGAALAWMLLADATPLRRGALAAATAVAVPVVFMVEPVRENLSFGQVNAFLAVLVVGDFLLLGARGSRLCGVGVGLATALKITPGVFLLYLAVTGRWRALGTAVLTGAAVTLAAAAVVREPSWRYFTALLWETGRVGRPESVLNQSLNGWLARMTAPEAPPRVLWAALGLLVLVAGLWRARHLYLAGDDLAGLSVAGLIGLCLSPVSWVHHAVWVLPALVVIGGRWWELRGVPCAATARRWAAALGLSGALVFGMQPTSYVRTEISDWASAAPLTVLVSGLPVLWCLVAIAALPARRRTAAPIGSPRPAPDRA